MSEYHDTDTGEIVERKSLGPPAIAQMPPEIAAAIFKVKAGIKQLGFDERNEHSKYSYASVDKFYAALRPLEAEAGLEVVLDEVGFEVREQTRTDDRGNTKSSGWAFINYEVWLMHRTGIMWGPLRRHIALPVTGAQTFGAAESYIHKAFRRGFYMVPTGEKDADDLAQVDSAPVTRGATRTAQPRPPAMPPAATSAAANGGTPPNIAKFLEGESYEIDPQVAGGASAWQRYYLKIAATTKDFEQYAKLQNDNEVHIQKFARAVRREVFDDFLKRCQAIEAKYFPNEPPLVSEDDAATILNG